MGSKHDRVDPERLRKELLELADRILHLEESGELLQASPQLIKMMGNLRSKLFEYEVRHTGRLLPKPAQAPEVLEAERIIEEAARRMEEAERSWGRAWSPDVEDEEEEL